MLIKRSLLALAALVMLNACSDTPRYTGREESTEGVPGFVNGKKVAPNVKLGQAYYMDGELHVPRHQPDYVEEGMASWYGPGFHGGKTANGERFDSNELTAAHRTLPLPSIVRVTLLSTGKQVYVRVNDRGPFAHSRIIDLSRAAASKIGLVQAGVGKVRVEYMAAESQRFADLLATGRNPKSIDLASEVLDYSDHDTYATRHALPSELGQASRKVAMKDQKSASKLISKLNPISSAEAAEPPMEMASSSPRFSKKQVVITQPIVDEGDSPFAVMDSAQEQETEAGIETNEPALIAPASARPSAMITSESGSYYVQLGAFQSAANAKHLQSRYNKIAPLTIMSKVNANGQMLNHVRAGRYASPEQARLVADRFQAAGIDARIMRE